MTDDLRARLDRHQRSGFRLPAGPNAHALSDHCAECGFSWPCDAAQARDALAGRDRPVTDDLRDLLADLDLLARTGTGVPDWRERCAEARDALADAEERIRLLLDGGAETQRTIVRLTAQRDASLEAERWSSAEADWSEAKWKALAEALDRFVHEYERGPGEVPLDECCDCYAPQGAAIHQSSARVLAALDRPEQDQTSHNGSPEGGPP